MIARIVEEYAGAQHAHRVLTEDVRFLNDGDRERVLGKEREVVAGFARAVTALRPDLKRAKLAKPLTMLLFGMINWMFTWHKARRRARPRGHRADRGRPVSRRAASGEAAAQVNGHRGLSSPECCADRALRLARAIRAPG